MSAAHTPTRVGFNGSWVAGCWRVKAFAIHHQEGMHTVAWTYAARSTDGGCVVTTTSERSDWRRAASRQRGGLSQNNWNL